MFRYWMALLASIICLEGLWGYIGSAASINRRTPRAARVARHDSARRADVIPEIVHV